MQTSGRRCPRSEVRSFPSGLRGSGQRRPRRVEGKRVQGVGLTVSTRRVIGS